VRRSAGGRRARSRRGGPRRRRSSQWRAGGFFLYSQYWASLDWYFNMDTIVLSQSLNYSFDIILFLIAIRYMI
jgi:hypothetical protein